LTWIERKTLRWQLAIGVGHNIHDTDLRDLICKQDFVKSAMMCCCRQAGWLAGCCLWVLGYYNCFNLIYWCLLFCLLSFCPRCIEIAGCTNYKWGRQLVCHGPYRIVCRLTQCLATLLIYDLIIVGQVVAMIVLNSGGASWCHCYQDWEVWVVYNFQYFLCKAPPFKKLFFKKNLIRRRP